MSDPVIKKYFDRVVNANSEKNSQPIAVESPNGKNMMHMLWECEGLVDCLKNSDLKYSIDGAIGLSLRQLEKSGSFLRQHRDIDILVPEDELEN